MTNEEAIEYNKNLIEYMKITDKESEYKFLEENYEALDMAIQALESQRYKPIILQEHDAEPRTMRAILDTATQEIFVCKLTKQGAEILGMTIEEVEE